MQPWPPLSPPAAVVVRSVCEALVDDLDALTAAVSRPSIEGLDHAAIEADPGLAEADGRVNRAYLVQWLTSNIHSPGARVDSTPGPEMLTYLRDLGRRGIAPDIAGSSRAVVATLWRRWLHRCLEQCDDREVLVEVVDVSAQSMVQFALDVVQGLQQAEFDDLSARAAEQTLATIQLLVSGSAVPTDVAESRLRYRLHRHHLAVIVWTDETPEEDSLLDRAVARLTAAVDVPGVLDARASRSARWLWFPTNREPSAPVLAGCVDGLDGVRVAAGGAASGVAGFRSSHLEAAAAQGVLIRTRSAHRTGRYRDLALVDTLTRDADAAARFAATTLGDLHDADPALRRTLLTYVQEGLSATRTAARLHVHRNTVDRRIAQADELAAVTVAADPTRLASALLIRSLQDPD